MQRHLILLGLTFFLAACRADASIESITLTSRDGGSTVNIQVEVADTPEARRIGLMNRPALPANTGMIFAFEEQTVQKFWMQNTLIPLDIMFFTGEGVFVNAFTMTPCDEDPCPTYASAAPAQFAIEVPEGFREKHNIGVGWRLNMKQIQRIVDFE